MSLIDDANYNTEENSVQKNKFGRGDEPVILKIQHIQPLIETRIWELEREKLLSLVPHMAHHNITLKPTFYCLYKHFSQNSRQIKLPSRCSQIKRVLFIEF